MRIYRAIVLSVTLLVVGGCDFVTSEPTFIDVSGTVVAAETGEPIAGLRVTLNDSHGILHTIVRSTRTGSDGRFHIHHNAYAASFVYDLRVNDYPYNERYTIRVITIKGGKRDLRVIELGPRG